jgi:hypothetical protein
MSSNLILPPKQLKCRNVWRLSSKNEPFAPTFSLRQWSANHDMINAAIIFGKEYNGRMFELNWSVKTNFIYC